MNGVPKLARPLQHEQSVAVHVDRKLAHLVPGFLDRRSAELISLRAALVDDDLTEMRRIGHNLKSNAGGLGFNHLSMLGERLEAGAISSDRPAVECLIDQIAQHLNGINVQYVDASGR